VHRTCDPIPKTTVVDFEDYAVAYRLLNRVFSRTAANMRSATDELSAAVQVLYRKNRSGVSVTEIGRFLGWEKSRVYKHVKLAVHHQSLDYEPGTLPNNKKTLVPRGRGPGDFLLSPQGVLRVHPELEGCKYVDPITGKAKAIGTTATHAR
jgi:hypothetical protein